MMVPEINQLLQDAGGGGLVLKKRVSTGGYTAGSGRPAPTVQDVPVVGNIGDFTDQERAGTSILVSDRKITISAMGMTVAPTEMDTFSDGVKEYKIIKVSRRTAGPDTVAYTCQCRI